MTEDIEGNQTLADAYRPGGFMANAMTPNLTPLSERMLLDGMYPGIVEKWAAEVKELEADRRLLLDLTPGGSEFVGSPEACAMFIRERLATLGKVAKERNDLSRRLEAAIALIEREDDPDAPGRPWLVQHVLDILRGEPAALANSDRPDETNGPACNPYEGLTSRQKATYLATESGEEEKA